MNLAEFASTYKRQGAPAIESALGKGFLLVSRLKQGQDASAFHTREATSSLALRSRMREDEVLALQLSGQVVISVGRTPSNTLCLDHPSISKFHAYFTFDVIHEHFELRDARSRNGTQVNGRPLEPEQPYVLKPWDSIRFGDAAVASFHSAESLLPVIDML